jgi:TrmH family RNA methyltransferase
MRSHWKDNVAFILVEPEEQGNIGASARVMKNMGFQSLMLVNPPQISDDALCVAHGAEDVLTEAKIFKDLTEAIRSSSLVIGTSRRRGRKRGPFLTPWQAAQRIYETAQANKVALLFGRESRGLYNEEVKHCSLMINIPTAPSQPSLNLSHAVAVIAYELLRFDYEIGGQRGRFLMPLVTQQEMEGLLENMQRSLRVLGYIPQDNHNKKENLMLNIRRFLGRAGLTPWELNMLQGLCARIEKMFGQSDILSKK